MVLKSTVQLLRFHFSFFLLPVFLFGLSQVEQVNVNGAILIFIILHLLVYPASNGYNSYMDRDTGPVGGIKNPLAPTRQLFFVSFLLDILAVLLSLAIRLEIAVAVAAYILASRAYSYRKIRLKKYPVTGFLLVSLFQGAVCFYLSYRAASIDLKSFPPALPMVASSFLIGSLYPLTQIYQHQADKEDGVISISYLLGYRGSFIFSGACFTIAISLLYIYFQERDQQKNFFILIGSLLPVLIYFMYWATKVWQNRSHADFQHSLRMNILAALCMNFAFFILLISRAA